jgi:hypothetical protein
VTGRDGACRACVRVSDGAGFVPLFQNQLARHISRLPQSVLDGVNETELMAMMEKVQRTHPTTRALRR